MSLRRFDLDALGAAACLLLLAAACGSRSGVEFATTQGGSASSTSNGAAAGMPNGAGAAGASAACTDVADCPNIANACAFATCTAGVCGISYQPKGYRISQGTLPNCKVIVCDGGGDMEEAVDPSNVPKPDNACLTGTCDATGTPGSAPMPAGSACSTVAGGQRCDGDGNCVACLTASDCAPGELCTAHACLASTCADGAKDGSETGVDCGGTCPPCDNACSDHVKDGDETDVDCGGACPTCADALKCARDQDCASDACDPLWLICLPATCIDQKQDQLETDVDCGGGTCAGCYTGKKCNVDSDCATNRCDVATHLCGGNSCADGREDGDESDVDCGGSECLGCATGKICYTSFDCYTGCDGAVIPHRCN
ncbi:MAG TPA: hypothetical protein VK745_14830 [Polyangiaceae bacterium]|jgi:hypothetical protein|nr:hypothetical protein [Polyangiaceae bacterium]